MGQFKRDKEVSGRGDSTFAFARGEIVENDKWFPGVPLPLSSEKEMSLVENALNDFTRQSSSVFNRLLA